MSYEVNWDDHNEEGFSVIPKGDYSLFIRDGEEKFTKTQGDVMWIFEFEIIDNAEHDGKKIWAMFVHNKGGFGNLKKLYSVCGYDVKGQPLAQINLDDLIGQKVNAEVIIEEYNGKERNKIPYAAFSEYRKTTVQKKTSKPAESTLIEEDEIPF
ncbi:MAG: DUF669 domain-containing protein [Patescibacteria group bacterium]|nr:DUF669 domain-containing protein [Patescibacteria group bacterium]